MWSDELVSRPVAATVVGIIAALLVFSEGVLLGIAGGAISAAGAPALGAAAGGLGALADLFGLILLGLSIGLYRAPDSHVGIGIAILILGFLSWFTGGGFILGTVLAVVSGILAIVFVPWEGDMPRWENVPVATAVPGGWAAPTDAAGAAAPPTPGPVRPSEPPPPGTTGVRASQPSDGKRCPSCGTQFESYRLFCPQCGAAAP